MTSFANQPFPEILTIGPGFLVLNKPAGLSTHNEPTGDALSATEFMLKNDEELRKVTQWQSDFAPAPVHRLDKETSGCLLLALSKNAAHLLQQAFENRENATKIYRAVVRGQLRDSHGSWAQPLSDGATGRRDPQGPRGGQKPCETRFEVLRTNRYFSDLRVEILSGRQHQIRRHAAINGHVVINDARYGDPKFLAITEKHYGVARMMLHAERLVLKTSAGVVEADAPAPAEFERLFLQEEK